ncbi:MAG: hypothetical protein ACE147_02490 [Candidatus Methylomirabilales bacterium]
MPRPGFWQRRYYVHPVQRKLLTLSLVPLIICSAAIVVLAFVPLNLLVLGSGSEMEKAVAAGCLSALGRRVWPAIFLSMAVVAGLSVFASHAIGGPLKRLEMIGERLAAGEFPASVRVRAGDDLQEIAGTLDVALGNLWDAVSQAREAAAGGRDELAALAREAGPRGPAFEERLKAAQVHLTAVEDALGKYRQETPKS